MLDGTTDYIYSTDGTDEYCVHHLWLLIPLPPAAVSIWMAC